MIEVKRPGKLFIVGEYSVVESGRCAIVMAVDRFIRVYIKKSNQGLITSFGDETVSYTRAESVTIDSSHGKWSYIQSAINISEDYLSEFIKEFNDYEIKVVSEMEDESGNKYGIGSSAAVTVAIIDAILQYYNAKIDNLKLFKLASLATIENSPNNSCGDIAASVYNGLVFYRKFDKEQVLDMKSHHSVYDTVSKNWASLEIERIKMSDSWKIYIGWTGSPASSASLVKAIIDNSNNEEFYIDFQKKSDGYVERIFQGMQSGEFQLVKDNIELARDNLLDLSRTFESEIETKSLKELSDIAKGLGMASKSSGAGGGDCGIAISASSVDTERLKISWQEKNIIMLPFEIFEGE